MLHSFLVLISRDSKHSSSRRDNNRIGLVARLTISEKKKNQQIMRTRIAMQYWKSKIEKHGGKGANHIIVLLWLLTAACIKVGWPQIARRAIEVAELRLAKDEWPEYYGGKSGLENRHASIKHGLLRFIWWLK
ncbi:hypothetical protein M8C21_018586 [Ambrosia artemisiifolia]|uniref:Uncharacterized protein n=1 Tax=Ambrosia artemisiifolia TaxID=4212 RepID=A0AAD5CQ41_AMBAR|nr:hypothetical protein M8C21_018586 [Ambrosia artemisiifolia]